MLSQRQQAENMRLTAIEYDVLRWFVITLPGFAQELRVKTINHEKTRKNTKKENMIRVSSC